MAWIRKVVLQPVCQPGRHAWLQETERTGSCGSKMVASFSTERGLSLVKRFCQTIDTALCLIMIPSSAEIMHLAFQFGESHEPCAVLNRQFRMSRNGRHLGHVGGPEVP